MFDRISKVEKENEGLKEIIDHLMQEKNNITNNYLKFYS